MNVTGIVDLADCSTPHVVNEPAPDETSGTTVSAVQIIRHVTSMTNGSDTLSELRRAGHVGCHHCVVDDDLTTDAEFERTQHIGNAINALAQAELAVTAVDELPPEVAVRLDRVMRDILGD